MKDSGIIPLFQLINLDPYTIMVDYEKDAINALSTTFPFTESLG